jgi:hypothetical protein
MAEGKAERMMCVSYTRKVAQGKASVLLKKIPYGVVIVDDSLKIIDSNRKFARYWEKMYLISMNRRTAWKKRI